MFLEMNLQFENWIKKRLKSIGAKGDKGFTLLKLKTTNSGERSKLNIF